MADFKSQIARHCNTLNELHERIHATLEVRDRSEANRRAWKDACSKFQGFQSDVNKYLDKVSAETVSQDKQIRQFVFDFLSLDPIFYRSGYEKERILRVLKKFDLTDHEKTVLRQTILRRIRNGALREFRRFCQFIPQVQTENFINELQAAARSTDENIKRRAVFALEYVVAQSCCPAVETGRSLPSMSK
ncbi:hypothetical protein [Pseudophaeobacter leonis]|uniref:hypothetical protein n=1 Tax=Pseudophaeobacter leonis TaxID=1144477 RepID=UPI0009F449E5|nr:hypothetical protein [Pseudophaeobacter leonis]